MKFHHLNASIANNADQQPSLFMALCMVESLFADLEAACGNEVAHCPVGDERLPTKLIWLSRMINGIYQTQSEELQRNRVRLDAAMKTNDQTRMELESLTDVSDQMAKLRMEQADLQQQISRKKTAVQEYEQLQAWCSAARAKLEQLEAFDTDSAKREQQLLTEKLATIRQNVAVLQDTQKAVRTELSDAESVHDSLVVQISRQKAQNEALEEEIKQIQSRLNALTEEKTRLEKNRSGTLLNLNALQNDVEHLKNKKLPEAEELLQQELTRHNKLHEKIAAAQTQSEELQQKIAYLEEQLPILTEQVEHGQQSYDALTASYIASSKELKSLEQQIAELRNNNDQEKLAIYRKQLEDNRKKLEDIQAECVEIQEEDRQLKVRLEEEQKEVARLLELKRKHESGSDALTQRLRELEFVNTPAYLTETAGIADRLELLELVRSNLATTVGKLRRVLGGEPVAMAATLEEQLKAELQALRMRSSELRTALINCADSLKLEEQ